ncbi:hypothetical protein lerEdw1_005076 [Lerista edwardsae]|nr:hypothetical protein lerEdw1_005076 [Lerista edwardsae]
MERPEALREFRGLVERVGGRQRLLLVGEGARDGEPPQPARALLETFARDLFAEGGKDGSGGAAREEEEEARPAGARRVRVGSGGGERRWRSCPLLFVLFRASSLQGRRERRCLREILRDVRGHLPSRRAAGPPPVLVGVVVLAASAAEPSPAHCAPARDEALQDDARRLLEALLHQVFPERRRQEERRPGLQDTLQAAAYVPGGARGAAEVRAAACRALRAALKLQADRADVKEMQLPAFLQCIPWGRRSPKRKGHLGKAANNSTEDCLQVAEEGVALTNMTLNGEL